MPEWFKLILTRLATAHAEELWDWLDGEPEVALEMIECITKTHPELLRSAVTEDAEG
jgi:hypothetical protein